MAKPQRKTQGSYRKRNQYGFVWVIAGLIVLSVAGMWAAAEFTKPERRIPALETFADEGAGHVDPGTALTYKTDPPTSGAHWPTATPPGFYAEAQPAGAVVHALEHGRIVMYYNPQSTPANVVDKLKAYAQQYPGDWDGVVVLPREQPEQVVLTAWRHALRLSTWDVAQAEAFIDAFRGRGPENPVR